MRSAIFLAAITLVSTTAAAQDRFAGGMLQARFPSSARLLDTPRTLPVYRVEPSMVRSTTQGRPVDEVNAITMRKPRHFRFRPMMAFTFDPEDLGAPARMSGIAPKLLGGQMRP